MKVRSMLPCPKEIRTPVIISRGYPHIISLFSVEVVHIIFICINQSLILGLWHCKALSSGARDRTNQQRKGMCISRIALHFLQGVQEMCPAEVGMDGILELIKANINTWASGAV